MNELLLSTFNNIWRSFSWRQLSKFHQMKKTVALKTLTLADCFFCVELACFLTCCHSFSVVQSMIASFVCVFMCVLQPVRRLRSVSMPGENPQTCIAALETSNNYLRPPAERLPSITQSIKRLDTHTHTHTGI